MNTKQVEELTGLSRQNIRYYEREGLLTPCREQQNSYRDYSEEDVERLKLIKMLRMLDMPLKEIEKIIKNEISIQEAAALRQKELQEQQKQLQAAIDICALLKKEKTPEICVDQYLSKMESMEKNGNVFAKFIDDYQQVVSEEEGKQFSFFTEENIHSVNDFENVLKNYAKTQKLKFRVKEKGKVLKVCFNQELYSAVYSFENPGYQVTCKMLTENPESHVSSGKRKLILTIHSVSANIRCHFLKSICSFSVSFLLVLLLGIYLGNLNQIQMQIEKLPAALPVYGRIYNAGGTSDNHLVIKEAFADGIRSSAYTEEIRETVDFISKNEAGEMIEIAAMENEALPYLQDGQCIADSLFLKNNDLKVGDKIKLPIYCYISSVLVEGLTDHFMKEVELEIAGTEDLEEDLRLPLSFAKKLFLEAGDVYQASSFSFRVKNPELLNDFKAEMEELGLKEISSGEKDACYGTALGIEDAAFIEASTKLESNRTLLLSFFPIILILLLIAEYLISYLLLQSRRQEFAIMRALGRSKRECAGILFAEQMVLILAGTVTGSIFYCLLNGPDKTLLLLIVLFMVIAAIGVVSAINMLGRFRVAAVLTRRD